MALKETNIDNLNEETNERAKAIYKLADYLARRDHSEFELRQKLQQKFSPKVTAQSLEYAREQGWLLDPYELAKKVTESLHRRHKGHLYIQNYLKQKQLPATDVDDETELEKIEHHWRKQFPQLTEVNELSYAQKQKLTQQLSRKGFLLGHLRRALNF